MTKRTRDDEYVFMMEDAIREFRHFPSPEAQVANRFEMIIARYLPQGVRNRTFFINFAARYFLKLFMRYLLHDRQLRTDQGVYQGILENWNITMRNEENKLVVGPRDFIAYLSTTRSDRFKGTYFILEEPSILHSSWTVQHVLEETGIYKLAFEMYMLDAEFACERLRVNILSYS